MSPAPARDELRTSGLVRLTRPQLIGTMLGLILAVMLASLDQTIVGTAEPGIIAQLSGFERYPWVATNYLLSETLAIPVFARLSDIYGRKWFFLAGAGMFMLTSALCGASGTLGFPPSDGMNQLIVFRGLQGIGGGMMMGLAFTIIGDVFSPAERGKYQAFFAAAYGFAAMIGPTLGGWLTDHVSWRACFYVNLPVGIVAVAAIWLGFPYCRPEGVKRSIDWAGVVALILSVVPLLLALTWATSYGWASARVEFLLAMSVAMLVVFVRVEGKAIEPLIPMVLFRNPVISVAAAASFILGMGLLGAIIYLPLFMQGVLGVSATESGNLPMPLLLSVVCGSIVTGQTNLRRRTYKPSAVAGSILIAAGMVLFARMGATTEHIEVLTGMLVAGFGMGMLMPVYTVAIQNVTAREHMGAASALPAFFRSIGSTVGVAVFGTVLLTNYQHDFRAGVPAGTEGILLKPFGNPLMLVQMRPQLDAMFGGYPGGPALLKTLLENVRAALLRGINLIFVSSAAIMIAAVVLNLMLRNIPLRHDALQPDAAPALPRTSTRKLQRFKIRDCAATITPGPRIEASSERSADPIEREIAALIARMRASAISRDTHFELDLYLDSLERVELIANVERAFGIDVTSLQSAEIYNVGDLIETARRCSGAGAQATGWRDWTGILRQPLTPAERALANTCLRRRPFLEAGWYCFARVVALAFRCTMRLKVRRSAGFPQPPFLLCCNHLSYLDEAVVVSSLPFPVFRRIFGLVASMYLRGRFARWIAPMLRILPIDRDKNLLKGLRMSKAGLENGLILCIFPEGTRSWDGELQVIKKGSAILACALQLPVVPVGIDGTFEAWPRGRSFPQRHPVSISIGEAISPRPDDTPELFNERIFAAMSREVEAAKSLRRS